MKDIQDFLDRTGMLQKDLAAHVSIGPSSFSRLMTGQRPIRMAEAERLKAAMIELERPVRRAPSPAPAAPAPEDDKAEKWALEIAHKMGLPMTSEDTATIVRELPRLMRSGKIDINTQDAISALKLLSRVFSRLSE